MKTVWSTLRVLLPLLPVGARRFLGMYVVATSALTSLDVVAMALIALIISPTVNGDPVVLPIFGTMPTSATPLIILIACFLIIAKSAAALSMHWVATRRFARYEFEIGKRLFSGYLHSTWEERSKRSVAEITRIADVGISQTIAGFILPLATLPQTALTILLVVGVLVVAQPLTALVALGYLGIVALAINRIITRRTLNASKENINVSYRVARLMTEIVEALKELTLRGRLDQVADIVAQQRVRAVTARANVSFLATIPRYSFEAALIGGFLIVGFSAYLFSDIQGATIAVALFAATGFRLVPALIGLQGGIIDANANLPYAHDVIGDLQGAESNVAVPVTTVDEVPLPENPSRLDLTQVVFTYPGTDEPVLRGLNLSIPLGSSLGIVGPSGAGKSTLIDLILGLVTPTGGRISVDDTNLPDVIHSWRERVGYVPQRVALFDGTIAQNVALTWDDDIDRDKVHAVLQQAQLTALIDARGGGIDERIGERGVSLSGGQQQRLGIARALYSDPLVLVLDEATSSLDTKTEDDVTQAIRALRGSITVIAVAHRISTIKDFDRIAYLDQGRILGVDSFDRLANSLPQFGLQVALAGLMTDSTDRLDP